jgi:hypothetical protein
MLVVSGLKVRIRPHYLMSKGIMKFTGNVPVIHNRLAWKFNTDHKTLFISKYYLHTAYKIFCDFIPMNHKILKYEGCLKRDRTF